MSKTWRVIDADGAEHEATVEVHDDYDRSDLAVTMRGRRGIYHGATPIRSAIAHQSWSLDIAVAEILAPGQPSRDESIAAALATGHDDSVRLAQTNAALRTVARDGGVFGVDDGLAVVSLRSLDEARAEVASLKASRATPAWGPLPTATEVDAHVAHIAPARPRRGAPWVRKHGDSSGDGVSIVYLAVIYDRVQWRTPTGGEWHALNEHDRRAQWRPVDGDGMPVERAR